MPGWHGVHADEPCTENVPRGQMVHCIAPCLFEKKPAGQGVHPAACTLVGPLENVPGEHVVHWLSLGPPSQPPETNLPAGHELQVLHPMSASQEHGTAM